jgi:hypothetical protein
VRTGHPRDLAWPLVQDSAALCAHLSQVVLALGQLKPELEAAVDITRISSQAVVLERLLVLAL